MNESLRNTVVLAVIVVLVAGSSGYFTDWKYPEQRAEMQRRHDQALRDLSELRRMEREADAQADFVSELRLHREFPYRTVSVRYSTDWLVDFLAPTTGRDFEELQLSPSGVRRLSLAEVSAYSLKGEATLDEIFELIWRVENQRELHKISVLDLRGDRYSTAVDFDMTLEAYHSASLARFFEGSQVLDVPEDSLLDQTPQDNPFRPLYIPPRPAAASPGIDVRSASLVAIAGGRAVFRTSTGVVMLQPGDTVASGTIESVDQTTREVVVLLTENGAQRRLTLRLNQ
jgi:hypothetical protein